MSWWLGLHNAECWRWHHECAVARIAAALALTFPVPGDVYDLDSYTKGLADAQAAVTEALRGES